MSWKKKSRELDLGLKIATLESLAGQLRAVGPEEFHRYHVYPFLQLVMNFSLEDPESGEQESSDVSMPGVTLDGGPETSTLEFSNQFVELAKTDRNDFGDKISIGRTSNNDLVLRSPKISKFHSGFMSTEEPGVFLVADMGSLNGTYVNNVRLEKQKPVSIQNGDLIGFYRFVFRYVNTNWMIQYIQASF